MADNNGTILVLDVRHCARCGGNHSRLTFHPLDNPSVEFSHWAMCETTEQPILLQVTLLGDTSPVPPGPTETKDNIAVRVMGYKDPFTLTGGQHGS